MTSHSKFRPILLSAALLGVAALFAVTPVSGSSETTSPAANAVDVEVSDAPVLEDWEFTRSRRVRGCRFLIPNTRFL